MRRGATAIAVLAGFAAPAAAQADKLIRAETVWRFDATAYTIDQGEKLEFLNADALSPGPHDVTAATKGSDGKPLFASETVPHGSQAVVAGAQRLTTGTYDFFCSVHTFMTATLSVTDKGVPLGAGSPPPVPPQSSTPPDTTKPKLTLAIRPQSLRKVLAKRTPTTGAVFAWYSIDEPATYRTRLTARARGRTILVGSATGFFGEATRRNGLAMSVAPKARKALRGVRRAGFKLTLSVRDGAGNRSSITVRRTMRR